MSPPFSVFADALRADARHLGEDFRRICDTGGRLQGTPSAEAAFALVREMLLAPGTGTLTEPRTRYHGWALDEVSISLPWESVPLACASLVGSASTPDGGVELEVLDLGRGTPDDIAAAGDRVRGKAVMLRHEYAFPPGTVHRRHKLKAAGDAGAAAVVMVQPVPGYGPVAGGANSCPAPGFGVGIEEARRMLAAGRAHFLLRSRKHDAEATNLVLDLPGAGPGNVVLSAHLDGHMLGESAIDNGTGVAALLSLTRVVAPFVASMPRGLKVCVFGAEEWSLSGSRAWLARLPAAEIKAMGLNLNLDSVAGSPDLTALTSGFPALGGFVHEAATRVGYDLPVHLPISVSSDHANFAAHGVPALRLIAGFGDPECGLNRLLTGADTREAVPDGELRRATEVAGALLWKALSASDGEIASLRNGAQDVSAAMGALAPLPA